MLGLCKYLACDSLALVLSVSPGFAVAKEAESNPLANIPLRNIGPAMIFGRVSDFAVNPKQPNDFCAATASGNLWKTTKSMTTWTPLFEKQGSYAISGLMNHHGKYPEPETPFLQPCSL